MNQKVKETKHLLILSISSKEEWFVNQLYLFSTTLTKYDRLTPFHILFFMITVLIMQTNSNRIDL